MNNILKLIVIIFNPHVNAHTVLCSTNCMHKFSYNSLLYKFLLNNYHPYIYDALNLH